jgi:hypothetical protein
MLGLLVELKCDKDMTHTTYSGYKKVLYNVESFHTCPICIIARFGRMNTSGHG